MTAPAPQQIRLGGSRQRLALPLLCLPQPRLGASQRPAGSRAPRLGCHAQAQPAQPTPGGSMPTGGPLPLPAAAPAATVGQVASAPRARLITTSAATVATARPASPSPIAGPAPGGNPPPTPDPQQQNNEKEEPEAALLLLACGIGLATGAAIVAFNVAVHEIRDVIWEGQTLLAGSRLLLRNIAESELWPKVVFPPFLGGLAVGALGWVIGGYEDKPAAKVITSSSSNNKNTGSASGSASASGSGSDSDSGSSSSSGSSGPASSSLAVEQWKLQVAAVVRPVSRALAAAVTLGTGASLGPEGPSVDIGKSVANGFGSSLKSKQRHLTSLIAAGSGAGVAAGFNAPVAGVFFAVETVLQRQKVPKIKAGADPAAQAAALREAASSLSPSALTIAMVLLASVLAAVVSQAGLGSSPAFRVPEYRLESLYELPLYLVFGAVCGVVSASCSFSTRVATDAFDELRQQNAVEAALMPCIGGLTTGVLALGYPEILYQGFDNVNNILFSNPSYAPGLLIQIVVMKVIATSICRGSGLQGGLYAPSIFIGAALGSAFGIMAHAIADPLGLSMSAPQAYALVGVAAMLASNCQVPLTSVLLLFELTRDYLIILPTLAAVGISFWVSSLAAPSVKNIAAARRMNAAAAAAAAISTTQVNTAATEAALVGSLQGRLVAGAGAGTPAVPADNSCEVGSMEGPQNFAEMAVSCALERSCLLVEADMSVRRTLELMEADDQHVAVVLGQDGGVVGLVTRDVLEQCMASDAAAAAELELELAGAAANGSVNGSLNGSVNGSMNGSSGSESDREDGPPAAAAAVAVAAGEPAARPTSAASSRDAPQ